MHRPIRHEALRLHRVDPQDKPVFTCVGGFSLALPLRDGSHKAARHEPMNRQSMYDCARVRMVETREVLP